jgi:hypothetical protein
MDCGDRHFDGGIAGSRETEILNGVASGEAIILYPSDKIRDGAKVTLQRSSGND